ncbi:MAG TPA: NACHT domain-containing protein [Pseudonocardiaceae bacterium]|nr:NACHT domain-containing protein [Pseudonocardiaceae bacterium]
MPHFANPDEAFADQYTRLVGDTLDRFEFFGVDPRGILRRQRFDDGYVPLTLHQRDHGDHGTVGAGARADQAIGDHQRGLIRGVAGSGKSTLLRWLAVAARHGVGSSARSPVVPFVVSLGRFTGGRLPDVAQFIAEPLRAVMPPGWAHRMLVGGRVLLLLDGLDEVPSRERAHVEDWVEEHLAAYPGTRCVVTTRPSVVAEQWWVDRGFQRFDLLPMSRHSVERYVQKWHSAAQASYPAQTPEGAAARGWLTHCEQGLLRTLANRPALRGMSANPLLCGLLCALHLDRGEHLPESRKQVYDAALELLLVRWPQLRRRYRGQGGTADVDGTGSDPGTDLRLTAEELVKLLQRLAFWLVTNRQLVLSPDLARQRVMSCMFGLRGGDEDPDRLLHYIAHESGLLRELPDGSLEFVHHTFRDHLAAKEVVEEGNLTLMLDHADKPHWHDVVVMAGAHARPAERELILRELLSHGQTDEEHRDTLYLLAAAILEQSIERLPDVRALVTEAMAELIPPRTSAAADQLAAAGSFVLDLLPGPDGLVGRQPELVVRAMARIAAQWNPPGVVEKILPFAADPAAGVLPQLLEAWGRPGDYEQYARDVLSEIDFSRFCVELQNRRRIEHIGHLRTITNLVLRNDIPHLEPLAELPGLRRLTLRDNTMVNLRQVAGARSVRVVVLDRCLSLSGARPVDVSPLAGLGLRRLVAQGLTTTTSIDLTSLAGFQLVSLRLAGSALNGYPILPTGLRVRHLCLTGGARQISLAGVRGVSSIILGWAPTGDELGELAGLPELRRLVLWRVPRGTPVPDLPGVAVTVCWEPVDDH